MGDVKKTSDENKSMVDARKPSKQDEDEIDDDYENDLVNMGGAKEQLVDDDNIIEDETYSDNWEKSSEIL